MLGNTILTLAFAAGVFSVIMYFLTYKGYENTLRFARYGYHTLAVLVMAASALLLHNILTHQYQYNYVFNHSGSGLSTGLLISTFYAGQEGSFMLWTLWSAIIGLILLEYTSRRGDLEPRVMMVFGLIVSFLLIMVSPLLKSPFNYIWSDPQFVDLKYINAAYLSLPSIQNFMFSDPQSKSQFIQVGKDLVATLHTNNIPFNDFIIQGKGLNPLLQNFWMQIHPPMLFIGFSMSAVPFAFALAALIKNEYKDWVKQSLPWVLTGTMILGLAIMLGGYWAYGVLGWGGYWGWDPVENSSFVPWLVGVASIHTMLVQKKTQEKGGGSRFVKTNLILSIMTFVLVLYSTFLTRSGILGDASVHSFVDPGMMVYLFLVLFLVIFALIGFGMIIYRWKYLSEHFTGEENVLSKELALFTGSVALIATAIIVAVGTSAPIFGQTVQTKFYNDLNLPLAIIIGLLNGLSILLKWKQTNGKDLWKQSRFALIASLVITAAILVFSGLFNVMLLILAFSSSFALFVNGEVAYRIFMGRKSFIGPYVAHIGISLFLVGVLFTAGHSGQQQVDLVKGKKVNVLGHQLTFTGYEPFDNGKKYHFNIDVSDGGNTRVIKPIMFISDFNNSLMREPDILVGFTKDFYVAPLSYDDGSASTGGGTKFTFTAGTSHTYEGKEITFNQFNLPKDMNQMMNGGSFKIGVDLTVKVNGKTYSAEPYMLNEGRGPNYVPVDVPEANLKINITSMNATQKQVELAFSDLKNSSNAPAVPKEILTVEASTKPFISLVWIGILVMVAGFLISAFRRSKESLSS